MHLSIALCIVAAGSLLRSASVTKPVGKIQELLQGDFSGSLNTFCKHRHQLVVSMNRLRLNSRSSSDDRLKGFRAQ